MGRRYHGYGSAASGTNLTILTLISTTTVRPKLYELMYSSVTLPADQACLMAVMRFTATGTEGSGFTPVALDPGDPPALADYGVGVFSVEPTYSAANELLVAAVNQRATLRWLAAIGGEFTAPAAASNGLGHRSKSSTNTQAIQVSSWHIE